MRGRVIPLAIIALVLTGLWAGPGPVRAEDPPHPRGAAWLDRSAPDFHGRSDLICKDCHDPARWCTSCHFGPDGSRVPPGSRWRHSRSGHTGQRGSVAVCTRCHEITRSLGHGPRRCHDCHGEGDEREEEREHGGREHRRGRHERDHDD